MNPYSHMPPQGPIYPSHPSRRQDHPYAASPQPHYVPYYAPASPHPGPMPYGPPSHFMPQWYPYQQYQYPPQPQLRHYQQSQSPLVVSSTNQQPALPLHRQQHPPPPPAPPPNTAVSQQQPPPIAHTPLPEPSTTSSTTSQPVISPSTTPITASETTATPPIAPAKVIEPSPENGEQPQSKSYSLQLPWYSVPKASFPSRISRRRRKRRTPDLLPDTPSLPALRRQTPTATKAQLEATPSPAHESRTQSVDEGKPAVVLDSSQLPHQPMPEPVTAAPTPSIQSQQQQRQHDQRNRAPTRPVVPALPNISRRPTTSATSPPPPSHNKQASVNGVQQPAQKTFDVEGGTDRSEPSNDNTQSLSPKAGPPKSWAELLRSRNAGGAGAAPTSNVVNGFEKSGLDMPSSGSLMDALRSFDVKNDVRISFLEPRGLVNTGNMCYMNSILQVLAFCTPFFELLDQVRKRAVHSFKSNTPLLEAMIMFMNEYNIIDSASSVEQLRMRLKDNELEQYGESFIPEYVYEAIKHLPRFSDMRRGQQQDAEEFLGLLLEVLHLECLAVMDKPKNDTTAVPPKNGMGPVSEIAVGAEGGDGWMEVQRHQKPATTQTSGVSTSSPITKIFGGALRSEFLVTGNKRSVTLTAYQQLQLDINDPNVNNITHALKGLAHAERVDGSFNTTRGVQAYGTKQTFIETLPPMLILHLKRFHYDNVLGSTQKIWKRVGYPLELEIPKEAFAPTKRAQYAARPQGMPRYRLSAVVYHHGRNASGGHYTVDVRRQEGREWIRLDDTVIRRVRAEDVANEGGEEDPKILAAALERHKKEEQSRSKQFGNPYDIGEEIEADSAADANGGEGWSQVNANGVTSPPNSSAGNKKWSGVVTNGTAGTSTGGTATPTGKRTPRDARGATAGAKSVQTFAKDKVAYILFYERMQA